MTEKSRTTCLMQNCYDEIPCKKCRFYDSDYDNHCCIESVIGRLEIIKREISFLL